MSNVCHRCGNTVEHCKMIDNCDEPLLEPETETFSVNDHDWSRGMYLIVNRNNRVFSDGKNPLGFLTKDQAMAEIKKNSEEGLRVVWKPPHDDDIYKKIKGGDEE